MLKFPPLFNKTREFVIFSCILIAIIAARLLFLYQDYKELKSKDLYYTKAQIIQIYKTKGSSKLLKLKSKDGLNFYIFSQKPVKNLDYVQVKIALKDDTTFLDYLNGFFAKGDVVNKLSSGVDSKAYFRDKITSQHKDYSSLKSFYTAIYLADPLDKKLREKISNLGVSHLVALSGFHLGIMWGVVFGLLFFPYKLIQQRFFPWRSRNIDLGFISLVIIALYVALVGAPPALIRSYLMLALAWLFLVIGLELISFRLLAVAWLLILVFMPKLITSIALILSFSGVFYIFLMLKWLKDAPNWFISFVAIPVGIFFLMFPIGHLFFPNTSIWQLMSAPLSLIFVPFYPISALFHIIGFGDFADKALVWLFNLPKNATEIIIPTPTIALYITLSIASIFSKKAFIATFILSVFITIYCIYLTL